MRAVFYCYRLTTTVWVAIAVAVLALAAAAQEVRRAPSMGFMGMRGKKSPLFLDDEAVLEEYKRAPVMGFQVKLTYLSTLNMITT